MNKDASDRKRRLDRLAYLIRRTRELWDSGSKPKARKFQRRLMGNALYKLQEQHLDILRSGADTNDPARLDIEQKLRLAVHGPPPPPLSDEARARAIKWFGEAENG